MNISFWRLGLLPAVMVVGLLFAAGMGRSEPVVLAAPVVDQEQPIIDGASPTVFAIGGSSEQKLAQSFTVGATGLLTEVRFPVACSPTAELSVQLQGVSAGQPDGVALATQTVAGTALPGFGSEPPTFRAIVFDEPAQVSAGSQYFVVLDATNDTCALVPGPVGDPYAGGNGYFASPPNVGWVCGCEFSRFDYPFQVLVDAEAALPLPPVVNTVADHDDGACASEPGDCTLREAIVAANEHAGPDTITFAIEGDGPYVIELASQLPSITDEETTIDGGGQVIVDAGALALPTGVLQVTASSAAFTRFKVQNAYFHGIRVIPASGVVSSLEVSEMGIQARTNTAVAIFAATVSDVTVRESVLQGSTESGTGNGFGICPVIGSCAGNLSVENVAIVDSEVRGRNRAVNVFTTNAANTLTLSGLTISGSYLVGSSSVGIYVDAGMGTIRASDVTLTESEVHGGPRAVHIWGLLGSISDVLIDANSEIDATDPNALAIAMNAFFVEDVRITNNESLAGINLQATVRVARVEVSRNQSIAGGPQSQGVRIISPASNGSIRDIRIEDNISISGGYQGIAVGSVVSPRAQTVSNISIRGNESVTATSHFPIGDGYAAQGIIVGASTGTFTITDVEISDNGVTALATGGSGIVIGGVPPSASTAARVRIARNSVDAASNGIGFSATPSNVVVEGNDVTAGSVGIGGLSSAVVTDNVVSNSETGIRVRGSNVVIERNVLTNNYAGISVQPGAGAFSWASLNNIVGNAIGIENQNTDARFDGRCNWWGDVRGPVHDGDAAGLGDPVVGNVLFRPFLAAPYPHPPTLGCSLGVLTH